MQKLSANLFCFQDSCHVYIVRSGDEAVLVDFGSGDVLDALASIGVRRVTDVLMTHHHRDQGQGLARAVAAGARVWAPHTEQELFQSVDAYWQARPLLNNYDVRQDRFSMLDQVPLAGTLKDYARLTFGGRTWEVVPTPGHTPGSLSLLAEVDGQRLAFTGDLIAGPGKIWSMAALQWSYNGMEGAAASIPALLGLVHRQPQRLLPSHGEIMDDPRQAADLLVERLRRLLDARLENMHMADWLDEPYVRITPHLLRNRTSLANSYVLLAESGKALMIDFGYDFLTGIVAGPDRALHRPWLFTLDRLKADFGVEKVDVVVPTHYHDDHVAGCNLLRDVEGTRVWAAHNFARVLEDPHAYNLPCLWYDPIPVDRVLDFGVPVTWEEYSLTLFPLNGHTHYAAAVFFEVDGKRVMATGDQYAGPEGLTLNYVYQNGFAIDDYRASAGLYAQAAPDLILSGHWDPLWVDAGYFEQLRERGEHLAHLHQELLPLDTIDLGGEGFAARLRPYHWSGPAGCPIDFAAEVRNPLLRAEEVIAQIILPTGWTAQVPSHSMHLLPGEARQVAFRVTPPAGLTGRRFRLALDLTAGSVRLGQQAEALVDLL